jgi:hypothetical protein
MPAAVVLCSLCSVAKPRWLTPRVCRLLQASIKNEMQVIKDIRGFIQAETVVPKMVITYNRRKQGVEYLKEVCASPLSVVSVCLLCLVCLCPPL